MATQTASVPSPLTAAPDTVDELAGGRRSTTFCLSFSASELAAAATVEAAEKAWGQACTDGPLDMAVESDLEKARDDALEATLAFYQARLERLLPAQADLVRWIFDYETLAQARIVAGGTASLSSKDVQPAPCSGTTGEAPVPEPLAKYPQLEAC